MSCLTFDLAIDPDGPFSLAAAAGFVGRFAPLRSTSAGDAAVMRFAFVLDGYQATAAVRVGQDPEPARRGRVHVTVVAGPRRPGSFDAPAALAQVRRILSLDRSGEGYAAIGQRDPVVGGLLEASDYLRPVCFYSAYEAAAWSVLIGRGRMSQAGAVRAGIAAALGDRFVIDGVALHAFPTPRQLLAAGAGAIPGVSGERRDRLRGVAEAAEGGLLDTARLAAMAPDEAMREARRIRGIGPFYAALIYVRATGAADYVAVGEPRLHDAVKLAYGLRETPDREELLDIAAAWAPYRTWVNVLLRARAGGRASGRAA
jgi:DNA-3-methyladenine glycosylase II